MNKIMTDLIVFGPRRDDQSLHFGSLRRRKLTADTQFLPIMGLVKIGLDMTLTSCSVPSKMSIHLRRFGAKAQLFDARLMRTHWIWAMLISVEGMAYFACSSKAAGLPNGALREIEAGEMP